MLHTWLQGIHVAFLPLTLGEPSLKSQQGGDDTFGDFPEHLRALISHALPNISATAITYPQFETRGDLKECVGRFTEW